MTPIYFCRHCANKTGRYPFSWDPESNDYLNTTEHIKKYIEHSVTGARSGIEQVSLLRDPDKYTDYLRGTFGSGNLEIDRWGRRNYIALFPEVIVDKYDPSSKTVIYSERYFKAVKPDQPDEAHGFSFDLITGLHNSTCHDCGKSGIWETFSISV